jgi:uncharacterized protein (DUF2235 family)
MARNIVICCDGTANEFARDHTNVLKLYSTLRHDCATQCAYYHPGVGTMEPPGALTPIRRRVTRTLGLAVGAYLENDIRDAYVFLMNVYQPDDKVFLFGFSRGAYTVRALASLLRLYGLLRQGNDALVPYAIRMMTAVTKARETDKVRYEREINDYFGLAARFKSTMACECRPWFVGVWDTVSSVGWIENPLRLPYSANNPDIHIGRHAVAIDEKRAFFRSNRWTSKAEAEATHREHGPRDLLEVWFPGVHCDVGGGYPEAESGLSKLALEWMLDEAEAHGLDVVAEKRNEVLGGRQPFVKPDPDGYLHESLTGWWNLAEYIPKRHYDEATRRNERQANRFKRRRIPSGAVIHWSVYERGGPYADSLKLPADVVRLPKKERP